MERLNMQEINQDKKIMEIIQPYIDELLDYDEEEDDLLDLFDDTVHNALMMVSEHYEKPLEVLEGDEVFQRDFTKRLEVRITLTMYHILIFELVGKWDPEDIKGIYEYLIGMARSREWETRDFQKRIVSAMGVDLLYIHIPPDFQAKDIYYN